MRLRRGAGLWLVSVPCCERQRPVQVNGAGDGSEHGHGYI